MKSNLENYTWYKPEMALSIFKEMAASGPRSGVVREGELFYVLELVGKRASPYHYGGKVPLVEIYKVMFQDLVGYIELFAPESAIKVSLTEEEVSDATPP